MCALSNELVTFLIERSGLNIKQFLKMEKKNEAQLKKKRSLKTDLLIKMCFLKKFKKHNGIQTQFRLLLWAENFHQDAEVHSVKNISSSINSVWWYDDTSPFTMCPIQSLLTGFWGLLWVLKPSPYSNVSSEFILLAIFNYSLSPHQPEHLFRVVKKTQESILWCLCQRILKKSKYLKEQIPLYYN